MTKADREELKSLNRQRARVAKASVEQRMAAVLADFEQQMSTVHKSDDEAWRDLTAEAKRMAADLDARLAERCRQLGVPEDFRPRLGYGWMGRGENAFVSRRVELRKAAERRVQAEGRAAKVAIDMAALAIATELTRVALTTDEARRFLHTMPTVVELMPTLDIREIEAGR